MGSATYGTLIVTELSSADHIRHEFENCNPSMIWSDDSRVLAVPQLKRGILLIRMPRGEEQSVGRSFIQCSASRLHRSGTRPPMVVFCLPSSALPEL
jgi:hypothetical protein